MNDLASSGLVGTKTVSNLFLRGYTLTGEAPALAANFAKYEVAALTATGLAKLVPGTHTADQAVIVLQPSTAIGQGLGYAIDGIWNHEALVWPAGTALDTYAERKAFFGNRPLQVGKLAAGGTSAS